MANKKFWFGMLVIMLVFGMAAAGCDRAGNSLNGTWVLIDRPDTVHQFRNGVREFLVDGILLFIDNYTIRGNNITFTPYKRVSLGSDPNNIWRLFTRDELIALGACEDYLANNMFAPLNQTFSVNQDELTITTEGGRVLRLARVQESGIGGITGTADTWYAVFTTHNGAVYYYVTLSITNQGWEYSATRSVAAEQWQRTSVPVGVARGGIIRWQGDNGELITDGGPTFGSVERLNQNSMRIRVGSGSPLMLHRR